MRIDNSIRNAFKLCHKTQCPASCKITHSNSSLFKALYKHYDNIIFGQKGSPAIIPYIFSSRKSVTPESFKPVFFRTVSYTHLSSSFFLPTFPFPKAETKVKS